MKSTRAAVSSNQAEDRSMRKTSRGGLGARADSDAAALGARATVAVRDFARLA
jgi:hypothetical protein